MVDSAGPKKKAGPGARKKRRVALRIDMTPMVDIAFLLVIFFMTTTRFREPQAIEITLPKPGKPIKTKQSNVLVLRIDALGQLTYKIGDDSAALPFDSLEDKLYALERANLLKQPSGDEWAATYDRVWKVVLARPDNLPSKDTLNMIKEKVSLLTVLIQVDPHSRYKYVIEAMDAVNTQRMSRFSVVSKEELEKGAEEVTPPGLPAPRPAPAPSPTGYQFRPLAPRLSPLILGGIPC
jgi:biopolymer transport protein ExbD